ncbi:MAG: OmpA family protein [Paracoccaceae bacterium]
MRLGRGIIGAGAAALLLAAGPGAWALAGLAERVAERRAEAALDAAGMSGWARLSADGLRLSLSGRAPDRMAALDAATRVAAAAPTVRVISALSVPEASPERPDADPNGAESVMAGATADPPGSDADRSDPGRSTSEADAVVAAPGGEAGDAVAEVGPDREDDGAAADGAPTPSVEADAPPFAMVRNGGAITLAGPASAETVAAVADALSTLDGAPELHDGTLPMPPGDADPALARATARALAALDEAKAEFRPGVLRLSAVLPDLTKREALGDALRAAAPPGTLVLLDLSTPPPAISPFRFVLTLGPDGPALLGCDMPSSEARRRLAAALAPVGGGGLARTCRVGLGAPSASWEEAVEAGIEALSAVGAGRFELVDLEARLVATPGADGPRVETAGKALAAALPEGVSLRIVGPRPGRPRPAGEDGPEDWVSIRREAGAVRLLGAAPDAESARAAAAYARAQLATPLVTSDFVEAQAAPPPAWRRTALALVDALAPLETGTARFDGDRARIVGRTTRPRAAVEAAEATATLPLVGVTVATAVTVDLPALAATLPLPPALCLARLSETVEAEPILFAPGSADIETGSDGVLNRLAAILGRCPGTVVEVEGHTDAQGRESTNLSLSQARAEAVLEAMFARGVSYAAMRAKGYGESRPIADNADEVGRALNRRIAFSEVGPAVTEAAE